MLCFLVFDSVPLEKFSSPGAFFYAHKQLLGMVSKF